MKQDKIPRILAFIPARYESSRFPGKPLALIRGKSMISRIYETCTQVPNMDTYVVTDDDRIESHVSGFGGNVIRVNETVPNGTERVFRAWHKHFEFDVSFDLIFNIQGDIPLLKAQWLQELGEFHTHEHARKFHVCTLVAPRPLPIDPSPHKVKVAYYRKGCRCLYFSRNPIPHNPQKEWFCHLGVYSFRPSVLQVYGGKPPTPYEQCEGLEQLRFLEWGLEFGAIDVESDAATVDVPEDIEQIEKVLSYGR